LRLHYSGSYGQDLHILPQIPNISDANLDVPGKDALAVETIALLLHKALLNGFDSRVEEVSKYNVPFHFLRQASRSVFHTKFLQLSMTYWVVFQFPKMSAVVDLSCHY
jgi:hypothetical protein